MARRTGKHYILLFLSHIVRVWAHSEYVLLFTHNREKEVACCAYLILAWALWVSNNGKRIYEFMMDDLKYFHFIAIHPLLLSMHWLTFCLLPRITKLNDFLLFIIFGLSYYSFNMICLGGRMTTSRNQNFIVVGANGRQIEFPKITAICGGTRGTFVLLCVVQ